MALLGAVGLRDAGHVLVPDDYDHVLQVHQRMYLYIQLSGLGGHPVLREPCQKSWSRFDVVLCALGPI